MLVVVLFGCPPPPPRSPVVRRMSGSSLHGLKFRTASEAQWPDKTPKFQLVETTRTAVDGGVVWLALHSTESLGRPQSTCGNLFCKLPVSLHLARSVTQAGAIDRKARKMPDEEARMGTAGWCCGWRKFVSVSNACNREMKDLGSFGRSATRRRSEFQRRLARLEIAAICTS